MWDSEEEFILRTPCAGPDVRVRLLASFTPSPLQTKALSALLEPVSPATNGTCLMAWC